MVKQPSVIIIARHGARLDAADKTWHLTSPAPYDPPLTYGGWIQSRALGLRIASLLHQREETLKQRNNSATSIKEEDEGRDPKDQTARSTSRRTDNEPKKKKYKVYIHSSPFQRCVQTSIGISSGIAQYHPSGSAPDTKPRSDSKPRGARDMHSSSPRLHAVDASSRLKGLDAHSDYRPYHPRDLFRRTVKGLEKPSSATLRIDAFLGEWLSPDYFDLITPPPNSTMMVAGAKADLLRRGDNVDAFVTAVPTDSKGNLWGSGSHTPTEGALDDWKSLDKSLPRRDRTFSYSSVGSSGNGRSSPLGMSHSQRNASSTPGQTGSYVPPTPSYAVSPVDPIPKGYVAHARDACIHIDYQWDSMREPNCWGDGGQYGEEWKAMHKRFRRGLNHMIQWYDETGNGENVDDHEAVPEASSTEHDEDDDVEVVVVLVTHGAGCNALVGALTDQPVLLDVGMASLTMAVRKEHALAASGKSSLPNPDTSKDSGRPSLEGTRHESLNLGLSNIYELKIVASSDHLRPGVDPSKPQSPSIPSSLSAAQTVPESRRRMASLSHAAAGASIDASWNIGEQSRSSMSSALGSMRRGSGINVQPIRTGSISSNPRGSSSTIEPAAPSPTGLWSRGTPPLAQNGFESNQTDSPGRDMVLDFRNSQSTSQPDTSKPNDLGITIDGAAKNSPSYTTTGSSEARKGSLVVDGTAIETTDSVSSLPPTGNRGSTDLGRTLSQKGLWGAGPRATAGPKRRWTLQQE